MKHLSRREALRGTGVAALAASVAVVPFGTAAMPLRDPRDPDELFDLATGCIEQIRDVSRLDRLTSSLHEECTDGMPHGWGLNKKLRAEFDRRSKANGHGASRKRLSAAQSRLDRDVLAMSKIPATTSAGIAVKALVIRTIDRTWGCRLELWDHVTTADRLVWSMLEDSINAGLRSVGAEAQS